MAEAPVLSLFPLQKQHQNKKTVVPPKAFRLKHTQPIQDSEKPDARRLIDKYVQSKQQTSLEIDELQNCFKKDQPLYSLKEMSSFEPGKHLKL